MQRMLKQIHRSHRYYFQLLELMVAAFILLICVAPTMRIFTAMYQSQQGMIRENQRDHLAHLVHAKFTEQLYKHAISLEEVMQSKPIILGDPEIEKLLKQCAYECMGTFTIVESYTPQGQEKPTMYLGQLVIKVHDLSHRPVEQLKNKKFENQDPADSFYDYYMYIDAGEIDKKTNPREQQTPAPQAQNENPKEKAK